MNDWKTKLAGKSASYHLACKQVEEEERQLKLAAQKVIDATQAQKLVQASAEALQNRVHTQISSVVERCLETVFGEDSYKFKIVFESKRGKTEASLIFMDGDNELDPTTSSGGGVLDVAGFALRLACLMLSTPKKRRLLVLDEPFRFLSKEYRPRVRELMIALSEELDLQFLMVTHSLDLTAGKIIEVS